MERKIINLDDPLLKIRSSEEITFPLSTENSELFKDLIDITTQLGGKGMAAIQFGVAKRVFVMEKPSGSNRLKLIVNPKIKCMSGKRRRPESCFSIPLPLGIAALVERPSDLRIEYLDQDGNKVEEQLTGNNAQTFLHEYSHLEGLTMLDSHKYGKFVEFVRV